MGNAPRRSHSVTFWNEPVSLATDDQRLCGKPWQPRENRLKFPLLGTKHTVCSTQRRQEGLLGSGKHRELLVGRNPFRWRTLRIPHTPTDVAFHHLRCGLQEKFAQHRKGAKMQERVKSATEKRRIYKHETAHPCGQPKGKRKPDASPHRYPNDVRLFDTVQVQEANYNAAKEINRIATGLFIRAAGARKLQSPKPEVSRVSRETFERTCPILNRAAKAVEKKRIFPTAFRPIPQPQSMHFRIVILRKPTLHRSHRTSLSQ